MADLVYITAYWIDHQTKYCKGMICHYIGEKSCAKNSLLVLWLFL